MEYVFINADCRPSMHPKERKAYSKPVIECTLALHAWILLSMNNHFNHH